MRATLLLLILCAVFAMPSQAGPIAIFEKTHGADALLDASGVNGPAILDLHWNFQNLPEWDQIHEILAVVFTLRLRDDARTRSNDDEDEYFRYVLLDPDPNFRLIGDPSLQLPDQAGNTDYVAIPFPGWVSNNGSVYDFSYLLDGQFDTRVRAVSGDFEFRHAYVGVIAELVPEPGSWVPCAGGLGLAALMAKRRAKK